MIITVLHHVSVYNLIANCLVEGMCLALSHHMLEIEKLDYLSKNIRWVAGQGRAACSAVSTNDMLQKWTNQLYRTFTGHI